ncbi:MAG TPA: ABC transporter permease [Longimicrobiales bacterium]
MTAFGQDVRFVFRTLRRAPGFTALAVLTLGLGLGASTTIFSAVNRLLLDPLPFPNGDRIVFARLHEPTVRGSVDPSAALARAWLRDARSFEALEAVATRRGLLRGPDGSHVISRSETSPGFLALLGLTPALGRMFTAEDEAVVLLGHGLWQREFGGSRDVIGQTIELDDGVHTIIGVMPQRLDLYEPSDVWGPLRLDAASDAALRFIGVVGRLRSGITPEAAARELDAIAARSPQPSMFAFLSNLTARVERPQAAVDDDVHHALLVLFAAVGVVLLIACANVAQLLLARGAGRGRELAIRASLGAGRRRLIRQLLVESVILSLAGGALGLLLAWWGVDALARLRPQTFADLGRLGIDARVLAFGLALSTGTGVLFGLFPALAATDLRIADTLRGGWTVHGAASGPRGRSRARLALIAGEMALSVLLLVGAGLLVRSLLEMQRAESGFDRPEELLVVRTVLPFVGSVPDPNALAPYMTFGDEVLARVRALPGVEGATWAANAPPSFSLPNGRLEVDGSDAAGAAAALITLQGVGAEHFAVLGIPLIDGRAFTEQEVRTGARVAIIDSRMAQRLAPGRSAVGLRLRFGEEPWRTVVGVARHVPVSAVMPDHWQVYEPRAAGLATTDGLWHPGVLLVRGRGDAASLAPLVREAIREVDEDVSVREAMTLDSILAATLSGQRFNARLLTLFAIVALTLAAVGLFGLLSYIVQQRTREIGVRMALGARATDVRALVVRQGMKPAMIGLGVGLVLAAGAVRLLRGLLYGVQPWDPVTFAGAAAMLTATALAACYAPARHATRVDPMEALRGE